mmetsp:Transcript_92171/g.127962  ORF Transcript_92171/g.127962 Transcript_92171/m.127962 type:complete len:209 (+) Transcript_92171:322-948(+)
MISVTARICFFSAASPGPSSSSSPALKPVFNLPCTSRGSSVAEDHTPERMPRALRQASLVSDPGCPMTTTSPPAEVSLEPTIWNSPSSGAASFMARATLLATAGASAMSACFSSPSFSSTRLSSSPPPVIQGSLRAASSLNVQASERYSIGPEADERMASPCCERMASPHAKMAARARQTRVARAAMKHEDRLGKQWTRSPRSQIVSA